MLKPIGLAFAIVALVFLSSISACSQGTAFTYQGKLTDAGAGANGLYDFTFKLFNDSAGTTQVGGILTRDDVQVTGGVFTVTLDFGASPFTTSPAANYLEIWVRPGAQTGGYTQLLPRSPITSSPYAVQTLNATQLNGLPASSYVQTNDTRLTDSRAPTANSPNYIQNTTSQQATSNFNISGNGIVGGSVGVGTSTPTFKLNVVDTSNTGLRVQTNTAGGTVASFGGSGDFQIDASGVAGGRFTIKENGNTGIGTNAPIAKLDIQGGADGNGANDPQALSFGYRAGGFRHWIRTRHSGILGSNNAIDFFVNNSTSSGGSAGPGVGSIHVMTLDSGQVGIGTTAPAYKLHVVGENIRVEGNTTSIWPRFSLNFTGGGTDQKRWQNYAGPNLLSFTAINDAENAETVWMTVNRGTGIAISSVAFPSGNFGIGTFGPLGRLQVVTSDDTNPGIISAWDPRHFVVGGSASSGGVGMSYDQTNNVGYVETIKPNVAFGNLVLQSGGGNVGIGTGTTSPAATLEVNGYTKLGSDAPSIRVKKLTGTTAANEGGIVSISHGLDYSKILSISVMVNHTAGGWVGPGYTYAGGEHFDWVEGNGSIYIENVLGASASILSKPIKIFITYEQ